MNTDPERIAEIIQLSVSKWPGNCCLVSSLILEHQIVEGELCYGFWHGRISPKSIFKRRPFTHHAWIERKDEIIDATRWVFEHRKPYIFIGKNQGEYDFGGNKLRMMMMSPCPPFSPCEKQFDLSRLSESAKLVIWSMVAKSNVLSFGQMIWLANCPLQMLGDAVEEIYQWMIDEKAGALIPIDNRRRILPKS